ncbi:hypothetical protein HHE94_05210 [Pseudoalteromonas arctica]|uniref:Uncharacterized protein n=1 Tax=Pseudoalteromonas arctica TaxID=394751 RepID=A0AAP6Y1G1_9GAMM|nr:hypothetical protein [Pseudoalteromonas arctica]NMP02111.1 hypothetical protein [Pseudoalteromonas arctica]
MPTEKVILLFIYPIAISAIGSAITYFLTYRKLKREQSILLVNKLADKQLEAAEAVWAIFEPTSISIGDDKLISIQNGEYILSHENAALFVSEMNKVFCGKHGLYFPKKFRHCFHEFRDFIIYNFVERKVELNSELVEEFELKRRDVRLAIRNIIGSCDLLAINDIKNEKL